MALRVCNPEALGISSQGVLDFLDDLNHRGLQEHAVCILRHGQKALEYSYAPYEQDRPHMLFSMTKGFTGCAAGLALQEGKLRLDAPLPLRDLFEGPMPDGMEKITLRHLLTMTAGFAPETDRLPPAGVPWAQAILSQPLAHEPGSHFHYNTMSSYILSLVIQQAVGQPIRDYLVPRLFAPLDIAPPFWMTSPEGVNCGGTGLYLTAESVAKFGQMLLNGGVYQGRRILDADFLREATRPQADSSQHGIGPDWTNGYGFQFWPSLYHRFRADGMNGQVCLVAPDKDAVIAVLSGLPDLNSHMEALHQLLNQAFDAPPSREATRRALEERLTHLGYQAPQGQDSLSDERLGVYENAAGRRIILRGQGADLKITCEGCTFTAGRGAYRESLMEEPSRLIHPITPIPPIPRPEPYAAAYGLTGDTLDVSLRFLTFSYTRLDRFVFQQDGLTHTQSGVRVPPETDFYHKISD